MLANALILPFEFVEAPFKLVPPAWSVAAELINYFLLWLIIARSRKLAIASVALSLAFHVLSLVQGAGWEARYFPYYAAILPFSLGACLYFLKGSLAALKEGLVKALVLVASLVWGANLVLCGLVSRPGGWLFDLFFYANLVALVVIIGGVVLLPARPKPVGIAKFEKLLGDLAYPVFLCHWLVGFEISLYVLDGQRRGLLLFALSVIPILAVSLALVGIELHWIAPAAQPDPPGGAGALAGGPAGRSDLNEGARPVTALRSAPAQDQGCRGGPAQARRRSRGWTRSRGWRGRRSGRSHGSP